MDKEMQITISYDANSCPLEGGKKYKLHLPKDIPASDFWSIIVYDSLSRLIIRNNQLWPSVHSNNKKLFYNSDGSVDAWFGPDCIEGKESNWVKTIPGHQWYLILRLYYPLESWFNKKWQHREIEEITKLS
jgi:hypothetical protein